tara:strand:+ start:566 stop:964 length:399 start_codon:yes stop_codon:yes gene_type:complete
MAYLGNTPTIGAFRKMDAIQSSFDGSTTQFSIAVGGSTYQPQNVNAIMCAKNGVMLNPGVDFTITGSTFTFTTAPTNGQTFFAIILGDVLDSGIPTDNTVTNAKLVDNTIQSGKFSAALNGKLLGDSIVFGV